MDSMDKAQAIHQFWSGFGLTAYDENTVPIDAAMPYITYSVSIDSIGNTVLLNASLWYRSQSWAEISQKSDVIAETIATMEKPIKINGGYLWLVKGTPFAQRMNEPDNDMIRRIYINVLAEFLTAY